MADDFYTPYVRKIWGVDPAELSGELARRRVSAGSATDLLRRSAAPTRTSGTFLYPRRGFGEIVERLAEAAAAAGADLRLATRVTAVTPGNGVQTADGEIVHAARSGRRCHAAVLATLADPAPPADVAAAAGALEHRALVLCYVVLDRDRYTPFDAHYFPTPEVTASRVSEPKNYRDGGTWTRPVGRCCVPSCRAHRATTSGTPRRTTLAARTMDELARAGLPGRVPVARRGAARGHAYPVYRAGYEHAFARLDEWVPRPTAAAHLRAPGPVRARQHAPRAGDGGRGRGRARSRTARSTSARWTAAARGVSRARGRGLSSVGGRERHRAAQELARRSARRGAGSGRGARTTGRARGTSTRSAPRRSGSRCAARSSVSTCA